MAVKNGAYSLEEKREAVAFFNKNEVPKQIEDLLNQMFKEKPNDVFGYMVRIFFPVLFFFASAYGDHNLARCLLIHSTSTYV